LEFIPLTAKIMKGVYVFRGSMFDAIDGLKFSWIGELEITEAIQRLIDMSIAID